MAHHKILNKKSGRGHGLGKLRNILESPFDISATADASDYKLGMQLGLPRPIIKSHPEKKWE